MKKGSLALPFFMETRAGFPHRRNQYPFG